jgi:hypothetical protein
MEMKQLAIVADKFQVKPKAIAFPLGLLKRWLIFQKSATP